jgi:hypothetical protein
MPWIKTVSLNTRIPIICKRGQTAIVNVRRAKILKDERLTVFAVRLPIPVSSNQQKITREMVISLP